MRAQETKARRRSMSGFTLIELMVVVTIIGVLVSVAIPAFLRYQLRSKRSEAIINIGAIRTSQESFRGSYDSFAHVTSAEPQLAPHDNKIAWTNTACPPGCNGSNTDQCTEFACIGYRPVGPTYYNYRSPREVGGGPMEYCIEAAADLDGDGAPGVFEFQSDNFGDGAGNAVACTFSDAGDCAPDSAAPWTVNHCDMGSD